MSRMLAEQRAAELDRQDPLRLWRDEFHLPLTDAGVPQVYLVGNSLGLQPKRTAGYVLQELEAWRTKAVRGHFSGPFPWMPYHEFLSASMARLVGALPQEVVVMNSLTVNLQLMLATFYRPAGRRTKIMIEAGAFPSDFIAVASHLNWQGRDPVGDLVAVAPPRGRVWLGMDEWCEQIERYRDELALVLLPGIQYYTGQAFDLPRLTQVAHQYGIPIGFDLAHAAGNLVLQLHEWNVDFAVWCTYKYLNSGPGSVGACFVHETHARRTDLPRLGGWWGHDKQTRFRMRNEFQPMATAEGWQLSNPPILSLAAIRSALDVFDAAGGMQVLRTKSELLTGLLADQIESRLEGMLEILTPPDRGCQLSLRSLDPMVPGRVCKQALDAAGFETDWREPDVIRVAPVPLYNQFAEVVRLVDCLEEIREVERARRA